MTHDEFDDLAPAYTVGALDGEDRVRFESHLAAGCAVCDASLRDTAETLAGLAREEPRAIPPAHVKETLVRRVAESPRSASRSHAVSGPWRWLGATAVVASLLAAFTATVVAGRYEARLGRVARETAAIRAQLRADQAALATELSAYREVVDLLRDPATRVVTLAPQDATSQAVGRVVWSETKGGRLFVANLVPPPSGKAYEVWTIGEGAPPKPAGLLTVAPEGTANQRIEPPSAGATVKVFAVSLEPAGGVPAPTGPIVLASK
jgi:anti-sigma-K factor RskA